MSEKMTTSEPTTENVIQQIEGRQSLLEAANVARDAADSILNKVAPTTGNIAKALRVCFEKTCACSECPFEYESCGDLEQLAADRLESQERTIADKDAKISALTARAEQAAHNARRLSTTLSRCRKEPNV